MSEDSARPRLPFPPQKNTGKNTAPFAEAARSRMDRCVDKPIHRVSGPRSHEGRDACEWPDPPRQDRVDARDEAAAASRSKAGGPGVLTAEQAAQHLGRTAEFWRRAAAAGESAGAWQDTAGGPWRLPRDSCEDHLRSLQCRGRKRSDAPVIFFYGGNARGPRSA